MRYSTPIYFGPAFMNIYHTKVPNIKVIYIRLAIKIHLDGKVSSFALVSKQKLTKTKHKSRQKGNILYQVFVVYWIGHWSFTWEVRVQSLATSFLLCLYFVSFFYSKFPAISNLQLIQELETRALARLTKKCLLIRFHNGQPNIYNVGLHASCFLESFKSGVSSFL